VPDRLGLLIGPAKDNSQKFSRHMRPKPTQCHEPTVPSSTSKLEAYAEKKGQTALARSLVLCLLVTVRASANLCIWHQGWERETGDFLRKFAKNNFTKAALPGPRQGREPAERDADRGYPHLKRHPALFADKSATLFAMMVESNPLDRWPVANSCHCCYPHVFPRCALQPRQRVDEVKMTGAAKRKLLRVEAALGDLAHLVLKDTRYAPVFERLQAERDALLLKEDVISRAREIVLQRARQAKCSGTGNATLLTISNRSASVNASP
jgi:hypothetical protein